MGDRPTICLVMIVRNEAPVLGRCLASVAPHVGAYSIRDTGSTDGTKAEVRLWLDELAGGIGDDPWVNFGHNRSLAMRAARGAADYLLLMDANMELVVEADLPELTEDVYLLEQGDDDFSYWLPRLVRADVDWRFEGATHEHLAGPGYPENPGTKLDGWRVVKHLDGARRATKFEDDKALLEADVAPLAEKARSVFYLAQTHRDLGELDEAARLYELRAKLPGWEEEGWYAHWQWGEALLRLGDERGLDVLAEAAARRPSRAEPLRSIARWWGERADALPVPADVLFVHLDAYARDA